MHSAPFPFLAQALLPLAEKASFQDGRNGDLRDLPETVLDRDLVLHLQTKLIS